MKLKINEYHNSKNKLWDNFLRALPVDVYNRLSGCRNRKDDIEILASCYFNEVLRNKPGEWTPEDALVYIFELLDANGQFYDLTRDEYDDVLYSLNRKYGFR